MRSSCQPLGCNRARIIGKLYPFNYLELDLGGMDKPASALSMDAPRLTAMTQQVNNNLWPRTIGIIGGLGPYAHIEFERLLLEAAARKLGRAPADQDFPRWILASLPGTPERTDALLGTGPSPLPWLVEAVEWLKARADFGVIACNTAHAWFGAVSAETHFPMIDMIAATLEHIDSRAGNRASVGLLATTGTLESRLYHEAAARRGARRIVTLLDLPDGARMQEEWMMAPVYGSLENGQRIAGGIKAGVITETHKRLLRRAVAALRDAGAGAVILGCTELPLALGRVEVEDTPLVDPMWVAAQQAIAIAAGEQPLPNQKDVTYS